jgi:hypothetical protein
MGTKHHRQRFVQVERGKTGCGVRVEKVEPARQSKNMVVSKVWQLIVMRASWEVVVQEHGKSHVTSQPASLPAS